MTKNEALQVTKYKLFTVCQDETIQREFPELAEAALKVIQDIDRKIVSSRSRVEERLGTKDDTDKHESAGNRIQRDILSI